MPWNTGAGVSNTLAGATTGALIGGPVGAGIGGGIGLLSGFLSPKQKQEKIRNQSLLRKEQEPLFQQAVNAGLKGEGGAFGEASDYYRSNLSNNPEDFNAFAAPQLRQYNEEIVPGLSEQFAGMGAGGLTSSGFRNAQIQGATDLSERLGAIRANLRQSSAQGLTNIGQIGLQNYSENVRNTPQPSFQENFSQGVGKVLPEIASYAYDKYKQNNVGANTPPYQPSNIPASPTI